MAFAKTATTEYWNSVEITGQDIEQLQAYLFERETPLTSQELVSAFVGSRLKAEREEAQRRPEAAAKSYLPGGTFEAGDELVFPALGRARGAVMAVRTGVNPAVGDFDVITVRMTDGEERWFAARLEKHHLNNLDASAGKDLPSEAEAVIREHGERIATQLEDAFRHDSGLVRIAGRWFPRSLLVPVNVGHLNLAEAALEMAGGEPQPTATLLKDVALPEGVNAKLTEFSLNFALQEDARFDEVGPAGEVLWCLRRLEPEPVRSVPIWLQYSPIAHERSAVTEEMLTLEAQLDDELSPVTEASAFDAGGVVTISLIYPHLRAGTLPVSARVRRLFPTAYESPRVRFTLVDGATGSRMPGWVVREYGYVYGLREWFKAHSLMPGSLVQVRAGVRPGEVVVEARTQRAAKDWVRTLIVGADGGMVFAMLKQPITAEFNDRMAIHVPDFKLLDPLWQKSRPFEDLVLSVLRELTKLNPQAHVHAQELYAAVNLVRRVPPVPLFSLLQTSPRFHHVGDLHFRLQEVEE